MDNIASHMKWLLESNNAFSSFSKKRKKERDWGDPLLFVNAVVIHDVVVVKVENPSMNPRSMY